MSHNNSGNLNKDEKFFVKFIAESGITEYLMNSKLIRTHSETNSKDRISCSHKNSFLTAFGRRDALIRTKVGSHYKLNDNIYIVKICPTVYFLCQNTLCT